MPSQKSKYTCHSSRLGTASRTSSYTAPKRVMHRGHFVQLVETIATTWENIPCGHINRDTDIECKGCTHATVTESNET